MKKIGSVATGLVFLLAGCAVDTDTVDPSVGEELGTAAPANIAVEAWAHYYPWWRGSSRGNWSNDLGSAYIGSSAYPTPPAHLTPGTCTWSRDARFPGDRLLDVPKSPDGLYDEALDATIHRQLTDATNAGLTGFVISWHGDGTTTQSPSTGNTFNLVLDVLARNVVRWNQTHARPFFLSIGVESKDWSGGGGDSVARTETAMKNDLAYLSRRYFASGTASHAAFALPRYGGRSMIVWLDSGRKNNAGNYIWSLGAMNRVLSSVPNRAGVVVLGDERGLAVWNRTDSGLHAANVLDGNTWYWSSEAPTSSNANALAALGAAVVGAGKIWYPPATPGFNVQLLGTGHTCVARGTAAHPTATLETTFGMARASSSRAAGVMIISWNEYGENTYIEPSVAYGTAFQSAVARLVSTP